jgi:hypothetical protein
MPHELASLLYRNQMKAEASAAPVVIRSAKSAVDTLEAALVESNQSNERIRLRKPVGSQLI